MSRLLEVLVRFSGCCRRSYTIDSLAIPEKGGDKANAIANGTQKCFGFFLLLLLLDLLKCPSTQINAANSKGSNGENGTTGAAQCFCHVAGECETVFIAHKLKA